MGRSTGLAAALGSAVLLLQVGCASTGGVSEADARESTVRKASSHYDLGVDYLRSANTAMAVRELQAALLIEEKMPRAHHAIAEAYRVTGRFLDSEKHLQRALALAPGFQGARLSLSALYVQMERYEDAIRESLVLSEENNRVLFQERKYIK